MLAAFMACALAGADVPVETYEQRRNRALNRQRSWAINLGVPAGEVDDLVAKLDAKARVLAAGEESDWFWAFDIVTKGWREEWLAAATRRLVAMAQRPESTTECHQCLGDGPDQPSEVLAGVEHRAPPQELEVASGARTAADVNRERRARGELGTKRQRRARRERR